MIKMDELVEGARSGDRFFFHCTSYRAAVFVCSLGGSDVKYHIVAGHSTQQDTDNLLEEEDGKDECTSSFVVRSYPLTDTYVDLVIVAMNGELIQDNVRLPFFISSGVHGLGADARSDSDQVLRERLVAPLPIGSSLVVCLFFFFALFQVDAMTVLSAGGVRFVSFCFVAWWVFFGFLFPMSFFLSFSFPIRSFFYPSHPTYSCLSLSFPICSFLSHSFLTFSSLHPLLLTRFLFAPNPRRILFSFAPNMLFFSLWISPCFFPPLLLITRFASKTLLTFSFTLNALLPFSFDPTTFVLFLSLLVTPFIRAPFLEPQHPPCFPLHSHFCFHSWHASSIFRPKTFLLRSQHVLPSSFTPNVHLPFSPFLLLCL